jgi:hypothetical protein
MEPDRRRNLRLMPLGMGICLAAMGCSLSDQSSCRCGLQCEVSGAAPVGWAEQTPLGTPEALFSAFTGTCQAPFTWDGSQFSGMVTVEPPQGQSRLTATVVLDPSSARWVTQTPEFCQSLLEVDGAVSLELAEGSVAYQQPITISASADFVLSRVGFTLQEEDFGPWVSLHKSDPASSLTMSFDMTPPAQACSGQVTLGWQKVQDGVGQGAGGPFAAWSDSGCAVGQAALSLAQPWQGVDLAGAISAAFGGARLSGTWNDGGATTLSLATSVPVTTACAETLSNGVSVVMIPVDLVATTADGRVAGLSGRGSIRATASQGGLLDLQLTLTTDLLCATEAETLSYAGADCATDSKVTAQMLFNHYVATPASDGGSLELYVYQRQSAAPAGAADRVDRLTLGP